MTIAALAIAGIATVALIVIGGSVERIAEELARLRAIETDRLEREARHPAPRGGYPPRPVA